MRRSNLTPQFRPLYMSYHINWNYFINIINKPFTHRQNFRADHSPALLQSVVTFICMRFKEQVPLTSFYFNHQICQGQSNFLSYSGDQEPSLHIQIKRGRCYVTAPCRGFQHILRNWLELITSLFSYILRKKVRKLLAELSYKLMNGNAITTI